jgi:hypothetical protein
MDGRKKEPKILPLYYRKSLDSDVQPFPDVAPAHSASCRSRPSTCSSSCPLISKYPPHMVLLAHSASCCLLPHPLICYLSLSKIQSSLPPPNPGDPNPTWRPPPSPSSARAQARSRGNPWRRRPLPIPSPICLLHPSMPSPTLRKAMVAFPWWINGALASPWWIHGVRRRSSGVVVSYTQQAKAAHPLSHPWRRLDLHTPTAPQPLCLPSFPYLTAAVDFCGVATVYLRCCSSCFMLLQQFVRVVAAIYSWCFSRFSLMF